MYLLRLLVETIVISGALPAALILSIAGRWDFWYVWVYVGILAIMFATISSRCTVKNPTY